METSSINTIAIIGGGALGALYGSTFCEMDSSCVSFVAEGNRRERLTSEGLTINGKVYRIPVISPEETSQYSDLIIVAVKYNQLDAAIHDMRNRVGDNTIIMSVMNGIDSEERIGAAYGMDRILYTVAIGMDAVREGNTVTYTNPGRIFFGEARNEKITERVRNIQLLFSRAGLIYDTPPDMLHALWNKFMVNVGINQASAVLRADYSVFQTSKEARELMASAMKEVINVAGAMKINLTEDDICAFDQFLMKLGPKGKTSMLQDVEAGRETEVEMLAGQLIKLGERYGVPTPVNKMLYEKIKKIEAGD